MASLKFIPSSSQYKLGQPPPSCPYSRAYKIGNRRPELAEIVRLPVNCYPNRRATKYGMRQYRLMRPRQADVSLRSRWAAGQQVASDLRP